MLGNLSQMDAVPFGIPPGVKHWESTYSYMYQRSFTLGMLGELADWVRWWVSGHEAFGVWMAENKISLTGDA